MNVLCGIFSSLGISTWPSYEIKLNPQEHCNGNLLELTLQVGLFYWTFTFVRLLSLTPIFRKAAKKRKHISRVTKVLPFHIGTFDLFEREKNKYRQSFLSICIIYTEGSPEYSISNFLNGIFTFTVTNSNKIERQNEWTAEERQVQIENACTHTNNSLQ